MKSIFLPSIALAASPSPISDNSKLPIGNNLNFSQLVDLKQTIISLANTAYANLTLVAGVLAILFLLLAGLKYITSAGNANQAKEARASIIHVIIGVVIIVATFFIVRLAIGLGLTITRSG